MIAAVKLRAADGGGEGRGQFAGFPGVAAADARVRVVLVRFQPASVVRTIRTMLGPLTLEIAVEGPQHELAFHAVGDVRMAVVEDQLPVDVAGVELAGVLHQPLGRQLGVQRRAGDRRVEHELVEVGVVAGGVVDRRVDVFRRVVLQADDRRAQHADAVRLELADQREGVDALELDVAAVAAFDAHPDPGDAQADQLLDAVGAEHVGGAEDVERPGLVVLLASTPTAAGPACGGGGSSRP